MSDSRKVVARFPDVQLTEPVIRTLLRFTDARAVNGSIVSGDGPFVYIASTVADQAGTTSVDWLHQRFFTRVLRIWHDDQDFAGTLRQAAFLSSYWAEVTALDRWLDARRSRGDLDERPLLIRNRDPAGSLALDWWRSRLGDSPRLSQLPVEHVRTDVAQLPQHPSRLPDYSDDPDSYHRAAALLLHATRASDPDLDQYVKARLDVALDLVRRRRFAKVRMLDLGWPDLMERVRMPGGIRRLRQLEARVLGDPDVESPSEEWLSYLEDERLVEFLRVQPHYRVIFDDLLTRTVGTTDGHPAAPASFPDSGKEWEPYADIKLDFEFDGPDEDRRQGTATLRTEAGEHTWQVDIAVRDLAEAASNLARVYRAAPPAGRPGDAFSRSPAQRGPNLAFPDPREMVEALGNELWAQTFGADSEASAQFMATLAHNNRIRLIISANTVGIADLPWEGLRIPDLRVMAGLTLKVSIVRRVADTVSLIRRSLGTPVRILAVLSEPTGVAPLPGARQELRLLREIFAEAEHQGVTSLVTIENATEGDLRENLRRFRPHILHFTGHGMIDRATGVAALVLTGEDSGPFLLSADQFAVQLQDSGVTLALLNGCDTGVNPVSSEATFGVCQSIVRQGVPAAVATVRTVTDNAGLRFTQEFYQALIDGYPLEACVTEARKGVFMQGWDWSAWATFASDSRALDPIRLRR
jgi:hypothetical protein